MAKAQLMREIEQTSEAFAKHSRRLIASQVLDFLLFLKQRQADSNHEAQAKQTILERMGGMPKYMLSDGQLSDGDTRRTILSERIRQRYQK